MTPMQRDVPREDEGRVYGKCLCSGRTVGAQNKNKDTLYQEF